MKKAFDIQPLCWSVARSLRSNVSFFFWFVLKFWWIRQKSKRIKNPIKWTAIIRMKIRDDRMKVRTRISWGHGSRHQHAPTHSVTSYLYQNGRTCKCSSGFVRRTWYLKVESQFKKVVKKWIVVRNTLSAFFFYLSIYLPIFVFIIIYFNVTLFINVFILICHHFYGCTNYTKTKYDHEKCDMTSLQFLWRLAKNTINSYLVSLLWVGGIWNKLIMHIVLFVLVFLLVHLIWHS